MLEIFAKSFMTATRTTPVTEADADLRAAWRRGRAGPQDPPEEAGPSSRRRSKRLFWI